MSQYKKLDSKFKPCLVNPELIKLLSTLISRYLPSDDGLSILYYEINPVLDTRIITQIFTTLFKIKGLTCTYDRKKYISDSPLNIDILRKAGIVIDENLNFRITEKSETVIYTLSTDSLENKLPVGKCVKLLTKKMKVRCIESLETELMKYLVKMDELSDMISGITAVINAENSTGDEEDTLLKNIIIKLKLLKQESENGYSQYIF